MTIDAKAITSSLNGGVGAAGAPGAERNWDAERDAYADEEDRREMERHARAALANMAGRHPNANVIPKPDSSATAAGNAK